MTATNIKSKTGRPRKFATPVVVARVQELFQKHGFNGIGIADICAACDISPTSLYNSFGNKESLFEMALIEYRRSLAGRLADVSQNAQAPSQIFRLILEAACDQFASTNTVPGCFLCDLTDISANDRLAKLANQQIDTLRQGLSDTMDAAGVDYAPEMADILVTLMRGLACEAKMGTHRDALQLRIDFICAAFDC